MENHKGKHFDPECFEAFKSQLGTVIKIQGMLPDVTNSKAV
jgi:HD-GYP domain-containing protein (c-di-GMP phosphodiesterase class II)